MTPEQKAQYDKMGRTAVLKGLTEPGLQEHARRAMSEWVSLDDAHRERRDKWTFIAAIVAAIAAIIAAAAEIIK